MEPMPPQIPQPQDEPGVPHTPGQVFGPGNASQLEPSVLNPEVSAINSQDPFPSQLEVSPLIPTNKKRMNLKKPLAMASAVMVLLLGGSAMAYFSYYLPNKPQNILAQAVSNTLQQHQITANGSFNITTSEVSGRTTYVVQADTDTHSLDIKLDPVVSGIGVPIELLSKDGGVYFKFGDLRPLQPLVASLSGLDMDTSKILTGFINQFAGNQWIVIDSTLIKEAKLGCLADFPSSVSSTDVKSFQDSYKKQPFVEVTSKSNDVVNGSSAYKMELKVNDNNLSAFGLASAPFAKNLNTCLNSVSKGSSLSLSSLKDNDKTPVTVWIDKKTKLIVKYASQSTAQDKSNNTEGSLSGNLTYGNVNITAPNNAKPVVNLLSEFGNKDLLNSLGVGGLQH